MKIWATNVQPRPKARELISRALAGKSRVEERKTLANDGALSARHGIAGQPRLSFSGTRRLRFFFVNRARDVDGHDESPRGRQALGFMISRRLRPGCAGWPPVVSADPTVHPVRTHRGQPAEVAWRPLARFKVRRDPDSVDSNDL